MNLPPQAKKVFTGYMFDVYQWDQEMFDGSKETFEMVSRPDTVQIIATKGDKILYTRESQPTRDNIVSVIGGRVDPGETPLQCAERELQEESGLVSKDWTLWKMFSPEHKIRWDIYYFIARDCAGSGEQCLDAGEKIQICEATFEEFVKIALDPSFWSRDLAESILRMTVAGTLDELKREIFGHRT